MHQMTPLLGSGLLNFDSYCQLNQNPSSPNAELHQPFAGLMRSFPKSRSCSLEFPKAFSSGFCPCPSQQVIWLVWRVPSQSLCDSGSPQLPLPGHTSKLSLHTTGFLKSDGLAGCHILYPFIPQQACFRLTCSCHVTER